jgi:ABC-type uncharacterized transport system auxiliary subunit
MTNERFGSARARASGATLAFGLCVLACGSVEVPTVRTYRLPSVAGLPSTRSPAHVLRVQDMRLAAHVSPEQIMVQDGPSLLQAHPLDLWAGPLDRMITDVVVTALRRSGGFVDVKSGADVGREDLWLTATVTDFHYARRADAAEAVVGFDVQVRRASDHALVLARELSARAPAAEASASAAVAALSQAVQKVVEALVAACATLPAQLVDGPQALVPGLAAPQSAGR